MKTPDKEITVSADAAREWLDLVDSGDFFDELETAIDLAQGAIKTDETEEFTILITVRR